MVVVRYPEFCASAIRAPGRARGRNPIEDYVQRPLRHSHTPPSRRQSGDGLAFFSSLRHGLLPSRAFWGARRPLLYYVPHRRAAHDVDFAGATRGGPAPFGRPGPGLAGAPRRPEWHTRGAKRGGRRRNAYRLIECRPVTPRTRGDVRPAGHTRARSRERGPPYSPLDGPDRVTDGAGRHVDRHDLPLPFPE